MGVKKSLWLNSAAESFIKQRIGKDRKWSTSVNHCIQELSFLYKANLPSLTITEWKLLSSLLPRQLTPPSLPISLSAMLEAQTQSKSTAGRENNQQKLRKKISTLSQVEQLAVYDRLQQYWNKHSQA